MPVISDAAWAANVPYNGAVVNAWLASRTWPGGTPPAENAAPPSGSADAGPVISGPQWGGEGAFQITVPTSADYYLAVTVAGVTAWKLYPAAGGGGSVTSVSGTSGRITSTGGATPVLDIGANVALLANPTFTGTVTVPDAVNPTDAAQLSDVTDLVPTAGTGITISGATPPVIAHAAASGLPNAHHNQGHADADHTGPNKVSAGTAPTSPSGSYTPGGIETQIAFVPEAGGGITWAVTDGTGGGAGTVYVQPLLALIGNGFFGDGIDGAIVMDGSATITLAGGAQLIPGGNTYTLTRDIFPTTLHLTSPAVLKTGSYRIIASVSVTVDSGCTINNLGTAGVTTTGGAGAPSTVLNGGTAGGAGNLTGAANPGAAVAASSNSFGGTGGGGGGGGAAGALGGIGVAGDGWNGKAGGTGGTGAVAGGAGAASAVVQARGSFHLLPAAIAGNSAGNAGLGLLAGGTGGGGGGSDGTNASGGGGGGGGVVLIAAPTVTNAGSILATGGNGAASNVTGNSGGGGGGGGGLIWLVYRDTYTNTGTVAAAAGTGGIGHGTGGAGNTGGAGTVVTIQFT